MEKGNAIQTTAKRLERRVRINKIEKLMLRGHSNPAELAAKFNVRIDTIWRDMANAEVSWLRQTGKKRKKRRSKRILQMDAMGATAMTSFDLSKEDELEVTTREIICGVCDGVRSVSRGLPTSAEFEDEVTCPACLGKGTQIERITKIKKTPGDPRFLRVAKDCFSEAAKLEGLHNDRMRGNASVSVLNVHQAIDGGTLYDKIPPGALIDAKLALARAITLAEADGTETPAMIDVTPSVNIPRLDMATGELEGD